MDRQDTTRTARKIHDLLKKGKYAKIVSMAKDLNYVKVNNSGMILDITAAYEELNQREEAKEILLHYVNSHATYSRSLLQKTIELCLRTNDIQNAVQMCLTFEQMWPEDASSLLMRCEITAAAGGSLTEQIAYLEKYTESSFDEHWGYELANLYRNNGQNEECARICHKLILYFGDGEYVEKAARMKQDIAGLTQEEILVLSKAYPQSGENPDMEALVAEAAQPEEPRRYSGYGDAEAGYPQDDLGYDYDGDEPEQSYDRDGDYPQDYGTNPDYDQAAMEAAYQQDLMEAQSQIPPIYAESDEELALKKARYSVDTKLRQTEDLARARREQAEYENRTRAEMIDRTLHNDHYEDVEKHRVPSSMDLGRSPVIFTGKDREASVNQILSRFHRALQEENGDEDEVYITVGLNSKRYAEEIETRMRDELTMLSEEQIRELNPAQVKEIYELVVMRDVRAQISALIKAGATDLPDNDRAQFAEDLSTFEEMDPYRNLADDLNAQEVAKKEAEARAEARARAEALERAQKESRRIAEERAFAAEEARRQEEGANQAEMQAAAEQAYVENAESEDAAAENPVSVAAEDPAGDATSENPAGDAVSGDKTAGISSDDMPASEKHTEDGTIEVRIPVEEGSDDAGVSGGQTPEETKATEPEESADPTVDARALKAEKKAAKKAARAAKAEQKAAARSAQAEKQAAVNQNQEVTIDLEKAAKTRSILNEIPDAQAGLAPEVFMDCIAALADQGGYSVDENAFMTIAVLADQMSEQGIPLSLEHAKTMTENAIGKAKKRSLADKLFDRANKDNITILKDKHFDIPSN